MLLLSYRPGLTSESIPPTEFQPTLRPTCSLFRLAYISSVASVFIRRRCGRFRHDSRPSCWFHCLTRLLALLLNPAVESGSCDYHLSSVHSPSVNDLHNCDIPDRLLHSCFLPAIFFSPLYFVPQRNACMDWASRAERVFTYFTTLLDKTLLSHRLSLQKPRRREQLPVRRFAVQHNPRLYHPVQHISQAEYLRDSIHIRYSHNTVLSCGAVYFPVRAMRDSILSSQMMIAEVQFCSTAAQTAAWRFNIARLSARLYARFS